MKNLYLVVATIGYCKKWKRWDFWNVYRLLKRCLMYLSKTWKISKNYIAQQCHWDASALLNLYRINLKVRIHGSGN